MSLRYQRATVPVLAALVLCGLVPVAAAPLTGAVEGVVTDIDTSEPLEYVNIVVVGERRGGMSLGKGAYRIVLPVGTYTLKFTMVSHATQARKVVINAGVTMELNVKLKQTISAQTNVIEVTAPRALPVDDSNITFKKGEDFFKDTPIETVEEAISHAPGVVTIGNERFVHGGRPDEVKTLNDGIPVNDPLNGAAMDVARFAVAGTEFLAGGMDAEYGNAQSAVFNITTREGDQTFAGQFRFMTDDFGRADKTYTNYDNASFGFGGPTPWDGLRYYVSGEGSFSDGENLTVETHEERRFPLLDFIKARDRMQHRLNLQSKLSWQRKNLKLTGEVVAQRSRFEEYHHNWNVKGYAQKVYYFQQLIPSGTGLDRYTFGGINTQFEGDWLQAVKDPTRGPNPRTVVVEQLIPNPQTGEKDLVEYFQFRAVDVGEVTILWDEELVGGGYKPWVLFEGFQFPVSQFSHNQVDTSYVFFNSAERTPEIEENNLQLNLGLNHVVHERLSYSLRLSRLTFDRSRSVNGKRPEDYDSAGLPATLPNGTYLPGGVSNLVWYTDQANPYFVTAYDYPAYSDRHTVRYVVKGDVTSERGDHLVRGGAQFIYNDLNNDDRVAPSIPVLNTATGVVQQGLNVNQFHNFSSEGSAYLQDKWQYEGLVANVGMRWEFFWTGNNDEILVNNADIDPNVKTLKTVWSPRLGIAFPITDRNKFYFHYARYTQWPTHSFLFATQDAVGATGILGNPNLEPQLSVSYETGISHQFTDDIVGNFAVFNRDIYGLVSATSSVDDSTGLLSDRFINRAYASARGLELSLEKRLTGRVGFEAYYTFSFADGVASDATFGRSGNGLTHLPTGELPLDWDQRHTFNFNLRMQNGNNWGVTTVYQFGSGLPWTPFDRFDRRQDPLLENSERLPSTHRIDLQGRKLFNIYGRELTFFVEGYNLLDQDVVLRNGVAPQANPGMVVADMDNGSYLTETGRFGGAYVRDDDGDGIDDFTPVNDPTVFARHRQWRLGFGFEF